VDYALSLLKRIVPRVAHAILGFWLILGPLVVFLIRWKTFEVVFMYLLLIGAFLFVGARAWLEGGDYVRRLGRDSFTALSSALIGGGLSGVIAKLTHVRLYSSILFLPLVIVAGFLLVEYYNDRKVLPKSAPANTPQGDS
jgi:hypothetical protein